MHDELRKAVKDRRVILFVGSGVSAGLDVPTWRGLISHIGKELNYDPDIFLANGASYLTLAEYYKNEFGSIGGLRSWMDKAWNRPKEEVAKSKVHEHIAKLKFRTIYTTNYDDNIETALDCWNQSYVKITNVRDLVKTHPDKVEVVKFHGDFSDDQSIILTETDYFERLSFESPLDIKLRADTLGQSVLFIGYSLSDINVRLLLYKLWQTWDKSGHAGHRPPLYIFLPRPDPVQRSVLGKWGVNIVTDDEVDNPSQALEAFLKSLLD